MARAELGDVALVRGRLAVVTAINTMRNIGFKFVGSSPCSTCGREDWHHVNEGTPAWEADVRAVSTCGLIPDETERA